MEREPVKEPSEKKLNSDGAQGTREKPIVLIIDRGRKRSPLLFNFQEYLGRYEWDIDFYHDTRLELTIEEIIEETLSGNIPDYIYAGFNIGEFFNRSRDYILKNEIGMIAETADPWLFGRQRRIPRLGGLPICALIARSLDGIERIEMIKQQHPNLRKSSTIMVPWSIDPEIYYDVGLERDIDVAFICTASEDYKWHENRVEVKHSIERLKGVKKFIGNVYGDEYINILKRTKIFVVAGRYKDTMVQKYLEGAACGCMLVGEIPKEGRDIFIHRKSIISVEKGNYDRIDKIIKHYLRYDKTRRKIARTGQRRILKERNNYTIAIKFIEELKEALSIDNANYSPEIPESNTGGDANVTSG